MKTLVQICCVIALSACTPLAPERMILKKIAERPQSTKCAEKVYPTQNTNDDVQERVGASRIIQENLGFSQDPLPENLTAPQALDIPTPHFPLCAMADGISGVCDVLFDISKTGKPINVTSVCSHVVFQRESERAVEKTRFKPATVNGEAVEYLSMLYPLDFTLQGTEQTWKK